MYLGRYQLVYITIDEFYCINVEDNPNALLTFNGAFEKFLSGVAVTKAIEYTKCKMSVYDNEFKITNTKATHKMVVMFGTNVAPRVAQI